jgi:hypothetical protein
MSVWQILLQKSLAISARSDSVALRRSAVEAVDDWLVNGKKIAPHIAVIDNSKCEDGTFSRHV